MATKDSSGSKTGDGATAETVKAERVAGRDTGAVQTEPSSGPAPDSVQPGGEPVPVELAHHWTDPETGLNHEPDTTVWVTPSEAERLRSSTYGKPTAEPENLRGGTGTPGEVGETDGYVAFGDMTEAERDEYMPKGRSVPPVGGGE